MTHETRRTPGATILIVEDEIAIVELLAVNLRHAGYQPLRALTVDEARSALREALPDLVLLDWMLPGQSGLAFAKELRTNPRSREIPIIMLTARGEEPDKISGLEAGADDYVTKPFSPKELLARIKAVLRRRAPQATDDIVTLDGLSLDPAARRVSFTGKSKSKGEDGVAETVLLEPGPTEFRLLHFLMTHPERIYSRSQLLDQVWGDHVFIAERTVDVHIKRLREALAPAGAGVEAMVETVRGSGYRLVRLPVTEPEAESPL